MTQRFAERSKHRPQFCTRIKHHGRARPCGQRGDGRRRLERSRSGKNQTVGRSCLTGIYEQWRTAALSPCFRLFRMKGHPCMPVFVHAIGFAYNDTSIFSGRTWKELPGLRHCHPVRIAMILCHATDRPLPSTEYGRAQRRADCTTPEDHRQHYQRNHNTACPRADLEPLHYDRIIPAIQKIEPPLIERMLERAR